MVKIMECIDCKRRIDYARPDEKVKLDFDLCDDCYEKVKRWNEKKLREIRNGENKEILYTVVATGKKDIRD